MIGSQLLYNLTIKCIFEKKYDLNFDKNFYLPFVCNLHEDINILNIPDIII